MENKIINNDAAPELLAALEMLMDEYGRSMWSHKREQAQQAIAKAYGRNTEEKEVEGE